MPKTTAARTAAVEAVIAANVATERQRRGWSNRDLARAMTEAGCPITGSAVWRNERGQRRIYAEELVSFSRVFGLPMEQLVRPPEWSPELVERFQDLQASATQALQGIRQEQAQLREKALSILAALPPSEGDRKQRVLDLVASLDHTGITEGQLQAIVLDELIYGGPAAHVGTATVHPTPSKRPSKAAAPVKKAAPAPRKAAPRKAPSKATSGAKASASTTRKRGTK